jgi:hypothetical protein
LARSQLTAAAAALRGQAAASPALPDLDAALAAVNWTGDGSVKDKATVLRLLGSALTAMDGPRRTPRDCGRRSSATPGSA